MGFHKIGFFAYFIESEINLRNNMNLLRRLRADAFIFFCKDRNVGAAIQEGFSYNSANDYQLCFILENSLTNSHSEYKTCLQRIY